MNEIQCLKQNIRNFVQTNLLCVFPRGKVDKTNKQSCIHEIDNFLVFCEKIIKKTVVDEGFRKSLVTEEIMCTHVYSLLRITVFALQTRCCSVPENNARESIVGSLPLDVAMKKMFGQDDKLGYKFQNISVSYKICDYSLLQILYFIIRLVRNLSGEGIQIREMITKTCTIEYIETVMNKTNLNLLLQGSENFNTLIHKVVSAFSQLCCNTLQKYEYNSSDVSKINVYNLLPKYCALDFSELSNLEIKKAAEAAMRNLYLVCHYLVLYYIKNGLALQMNLEIFIVCYIRNCADFSFRDSANTVMDTFKFN